MGKWSCCFRRRPSSMAATTAKLIHIDGELEEFSFPVRVSNLLPEKADVFICNADEMDSDEFLSAVDAGEELVPGKLYFELPLSWLSRRLTVEVMASLAVKATADLGADGGGSFRCCFIRVTKKIEPLVLFDDDSKEESRGFDRRTAGVSAAAIEGSGVVANGGRRVAWKRGKFTPQMSIIIEE